MKKILIIFILLFIPSICYSNIVEELTKLNNLYKEGAINKEEFSKAKSIILKSEDEKKVDSKSQIEKKIKKKEKTELSNNNKKSSNIEKETRSYEEDLTLTYVNLKDIEKLGNYKKIDFLPSELFDEKKHKSFSAKADKSMKEMYRIFVTQKGLLEKYPENAMKGMAYFEYFYMDQLKDKKKSLEIFIKNYPNFGLSNKYVIKDMKTLYSLNQARKSMRQAVGLSLDVEPEIALTSYVEMYKLLSQSKKIKIKLTREEKLLKKKHNKLKENLGKLEKSLNNKIEKRISFKDFKKDNKKVINKINKTLESLSKSTNNYAKYYESIKTYYSKYESLLEKCFTNCLDKDLQILADNIYFTNQIIKETDNKIIKKNYEHDMSKIDLASIEKERQEIILKVSISNKIKKKEDAQELQTVVLNLDNNGMETNRLLDNLKNDGYEIKKINMTFDNINKMKNWKIEDWAKSWRSDLPKEIKDTDGNLIEFSEENIQDLKAQLAINTFKDMIEFNPSDLNDSFNDNVKSISEEIAQSGGFDLNRWLNDDISITLDNYSRLVGNDWGIEINDFTELTSAVNELYGTNVSPDEYAQMWNNQYYDSDLSWAEIAKGVDLLDQVGSFDAASIAKDLGADLQQVADTISQAAAVGISTDLEAAAQGLGYDSFADAVAAYNKQYGTNYTVDEAREALGQ